MSLQLTPEQAKLLMEKLDIKDNVNHDIRNLLAEGYYYNQPKEPEPQPDEPKPAKQLVEGKWVSTLQGVLQDDPETREVETKHGPSKVANFHMNTYYGVVKVGLWGKQATDIQKHHPGDELIISNIQVRKTFQGVPQLSGSRKTTITEVKA